jgi:hypothetical protein
MQEALKVIPEELFYIDSHTDDILHPDVYKKVLSHIAGGTTNPSVTKVLEQQLLSLYGETEEEQDFLKTYIPIALIYTVLQKPRRENPIVIAFNEKILESAFNSICNLDISSLLAEKNVTLKDYSLMDYVSSRGFVADAKILYDIISDKPKSCEDMTDDIEQYYGNYIRNAVDFILQVYTDVFSSGYEVIQPYGVLTPFGAYTIDKNNYLKRVHGLELSAIYSAFSRYLHYSVYESREFDSSIIDSTTDTSAIPYYPQKMLEYALGRENISNSPDATTYPVDKNSSTWVNYKDKSISYGLTKAILKMTQDILARHDLLTGEVDGVPKYMSPEAVSVVRDLCERSKVSLTACMLLSEWKVVDSKVIGFKVRVVDIRGSVPLGNEIMSDIIQSAFSGNKPEGSVEAVPTKRGTYVKEFGMQFDAQLCEAEPLFAFKALDSMKRRGIPASWDNLILGKYEDDTILSASSPQLNLKENLCHFIDAGSRSGKGVMTLNILASGIASKRPLFYLDKKPDMASLLKGLSKGKMFVFNGGDYQAKYDPQGLFTDEALKGWDKNIPDEILKFYNGKRDSYRSMGDIFYLRALFFVLAILDIRCSSMNNPEVYNKLGGENGIILVVDELSNTLKSLDNFISETGVFFTNCVGETELRKKAEKVQKALEKNPMSSERVPDIEVYSTAFVKCLDTSLINIISRMGAGWQGNVNLRNDIFILGQYIKDFKGRENYSFQWTKTAGVASGQDSYIIQNMFMGMSADGFFGYNKKFSNYLDASSPGSKASTKLTSSARNFAYVPSLTFPILNKIISGDRATGANAVYFKPCLILNESDESSVPVQEFKSFCESNKISYEDVKAMNCDANGNLDARVGFADYVKSQSPDVDIEEVLGKSYEIGTYVVQQMGYPGDCIEFIYDLRPEWMMTIEEMRDKFLGNNIVPHAYSVIKEYAPHLVGVDSDMSDEELEEYTKSTTETNTLFNEKPDEFSKTAEEDYSDTYSSEKEIAPDLHEDNCSNSSAESDDPLAYGNVFDQDSFNRGVADTDLFTEEPPSKSYNTGTQEPVRADYSNDEYEETVEPVYTPNQEYTETIDDYSASNNSEFKSDESGSVEALKAEVEFLKQALHEFRSADMQRRIVEATERIEKEDTPQDSVLSEPYECRCFGEVCKLQKYRGTLNIVPNFELTEDTMSVRDALNYVTECVLEDINKRIGLDRITDFKVMSDVLIFNNTCYSPVISRDVILKLPMDIQHSVANGRLSWVFLFSALRKMPNLTTLMFDSADFVYKKVRVDLGLNNDFHVKDLFKVSKSIVVIQIEDTVVDRDGKMNDDTFDEARHSSQLCDSVNSWGMTSMKTNWQSAKDIYYNPEKRGFWKAMGVTAHVGASAGAGLASVGAKATKGLGYLGRRMFRGAKAVHKAMKESKE